MQRNKPFAPHRWVHVHNDLRKHRMKKRTLPVNSKNDNNNKQNILTNEKPKTELNV